MGFFRRDTSRRSEPPDAFDANGAGALPDEEHEGVTRELAQVVAESVNEVPIDRDTLALLQVGLPYLLQRECSDQAVVVGQTAARLGYLARAAESAMLEPDHPPDADLIATLQAGLEEAHAQGTTERDAMADLAAALATGESLDPTPEEGGPTWTLPGLGGQARGRLRDDLVGRLPCPPGVLADDLRRTWKYGYFLCALDELTVD
ncbi:MAG: hypothetical protein Q8K79_17655 [Solirubrobacteraceae bacterium]|nr:hypothetical protein [Solirubrobacteraceae bacterium]